MPNINVKYSDQVTFDTNEVSSLIETTIMEHDSTTGQCKFTFDTSAEQQANNVSVTIGLLAKPHRDEKFTEGLIASIEKLIADLLTLDVDVAIKYPTN